MKEYVSDELTVLDYGIPDFVAMSSRSQVDLDRLQIAMTKAVRVFEPRLNNVVVNVMSGATGKTVSANVSGMVTINMRPIPLSFDLRLDPRHGGLAKAA